MRSEGTIPKSCDDPLHKNEGRHRFRLKVRDFQQPQFESNPDGSSPVVSIKFAIDVAVKALHSGPRYTHLGRNLLACETLGHKSKHVHLMWCKGNPHGVRIRNIVSCLAKYFAQHPPRNDCL